MTSNGGSGGDYQAVEANENRRRRINQVVTALNMFVVLFSKLGTYSLNPYRKSPYFCSPLPNPSFDLHQHLGLVFINRFVARRSTLRCDNRNHCWSCPCRQSYCRARAGL